MTKIETRWRQSVMFSTSLLMIIFFDLSSKIGVNKFFIVIMLLVGTFSSLDLLFISLLSLRKNLVEKVEGTKNE